MVTVIPSAANLITPVYALSLVNVISPRPAIAILPVHCVSQLTLLSVRWKFEFVQVCPGGEGGGRVQTLAVQSVLVFGGGLYGMPGMIVCEVVCQRTPGASARAGDKDANTAMDAAATRLQPELFMQFPPS